jgi:phosphatidylinositol-3-phosphatase
VWWDRVRVVVLAVLLRGLSACSGAQADSAPAPTSGPATSTKAVPPATGGDKVLVIVEENRSVEEVANNMPFLMSQARTYGTATNFYAITHPSLPNYLALAGGSTFGIADDQGHDLEGPSLFGQMVAAGRSAKTYAEAMPTNCATRNHESYAARHNPWTLFVDPGERAACEQFDVPSGTPDGGPLLDDINAGTLPTFGLLIPDICHDGHDCSAGTTDEWLQSWLPVIKNGPDFTSNRLAIVITWDEDDEHSGNQIPMIVIHPSLKGKKVKTQLDLYGLSASIARIGGIPPLRNAAKAKDALAPFGIGT